METLIIITVDSEFTSVYKSDYYIRNTLSKATDFGIEANSG